MSKYRYVDSLIAQKEALESQDLDAYVEAKVEEYRKTVYDEVKQAHSVSLAQINLKIETALEFAAELEKEQEELNGETDDEGVRSTADCETTDGNF